MFVDKNNNNNYKVKQIKFTIMRQKLGNKPKIFGNFKVDVSLFCNFSTPKLNTFTFKTPLIGDSFVAISFFIQSTTNNLNLSENQISDSDLTSINESVPVINQNISDWDIPDTLTPENKKELNLFFDEIKKEQEEESKELSNFIHNNSNNSNRRKGLRRERSIDSKIDSIKGSTTSPLVSSNQKLPSLNSFMSKKTFSRVQSQQLSNLSSNFLESIRNDVFDPKNFFKSILSKHWDQSPLSFHIYPLTSAALYTAFIYSKVFTPDYSFENYMSIIENFLNQIKIITLFEKQTDLDKLIIILNLISSLNLINLDQEKNDYLNNGLLLICKSLFDNFILSKCTDLDLLSQSLIFINSDLEKLSINIHNTINKIQKSLNIPIPFQKFFDDYIIHFFDLKLLQSLFKNPKQCTYYNAIQWNSLLSLLSSNFNIHLTLFKESSLTLMMSQNFCKNPKESKEICPNLDSKILLGILIIQQPDDFMSLANDISNFCEYFQCSSANFDDIELNYKGDFLPILSLLDGNQWKNVIFNDSHFESFSYLTSFYKD